MAPALMPFIAPMILRLLCGHSLVTQGLRDFLGHAQVLDLMVGPERLLGAAPRPFGAALAGVQRRSGAVLRGYAARPPMRPGPPPMRGSVPLRRTAKWSNSLGPSAPGVRINTVFGEDLLTVLDPARIGAPGEIRTPDLLVRS